MDVILMDVRCIIMNMTSRKVQEKCAEGTWNMMCLAYG